MSLDAFIDDLRDVILNEPRVMTGVFWSPKNGCGCPVTVLAQRHVTLSMPEAETTVPSFVANTYGIRTPTVMAAARIFDDAYRDYIEQIDPGRRGPFREITVLTLDAEGSPDRSVLVHSMRWQLIRTVEEEAAATGKVSSA